MRTGKGNAISYGKVQIASDSESLSDLVGTLKQIIVELGYPEKIDEGVDEDLEKAQKELAEEFKNGKKSEISSDGEPSKTSEQDKVRSVRGTFQGDGD